MYQGNENILICDHPLVKHKITMLRNKNLHRENNNEEHHDFWTEYVRGRTRA